MAGAFFLLELLLLLAGCVLALGCLRAFGGRVRNRAALLALGLYLLIIGIGVAYLPQRLWPVAREDNAFLGHFLFAILLLPVGLALVIAGGTSVAGHERAGYLALVAPLLAIIGSALSLGMLAARGPEPWQTRPTDTWGAGTFGFDVIAASIAIGVAVFVAGRSLSRGGGHDSGPA